MPKLAKDRSCVGDDSGMIKEGGSIDMVRETARGKREATFLPGEIAILELVPRGED